MKSNSMLKQEFYTLFRNPKKLIPVIAILFIPLMYAGMLIWAFWDPYGELEKLPIAVVNLDEGAKFHNERLTIGDDFVENLKDNDEFKWIFTNKDEAEKGLKNEKYYMLIEIPKDFSKNATTVLDEHPTQLQLKYTVNDAANFVSSQISVKAVEKIKEEVSNNLTKSYTESMFANITEMSDGLNDASNGASEIEEGVLKAESGTKELQEHLQEFAEKMIVLQNGVGKTVNGSAELGKGLNQFTAGMNQMKVGQEQLLDGAKKANVGTNELIQGMDTSLTGLTTAGDNLNSLSSKIGELAQSTTGWGQNAKSWSEQARNAANGATQVQEGLEQLNKELQPLLNSLSAEQKAELELTLASLISGNEKTASGITALASSAEQLSTGSEKIATNLSLIQNGGQQLSKGMSELIGGQKQLQDGAVQIKNGQTTLINGLDTFGQKIMEAQTGLTQLISGGQSLTSGLGELSNGTILLSNGAGDLEEGTGSLRDGLHSIADGSNELASKLADAHEETSKLTGTDDMYAMYADPIQLDSHKTADIPNYGTGITPYFLSLGLFVGSLLLTIVFPLRDPVTEPKSAFSWFLSKVAFMFIVGIIQALILDTVLLTVIGIEVQSIPNFIFFSIVISFTFMSIIQLLVTTLDNPGRFIAIILLILQLTSSAGTFPLELLPNALQHVHTYLPMTYTITGLKAVISSGDMSMMWSSVLSLFIYIPLTLGLTFLYFFFTFKKKKHEKLVPSIS